MIKFAGPIACHWNILSNTWINIQNTIIIIMNPNPDIKQTS